MSDFDMMIAECNASLDECAANLDEISRGLDQISHDLDIINRWVNGLGVVTLLFFIFVAALVVA